MPRWTRSYATGLHKFHEALKSISLYNVEQYSEEAKNHQTEENASQEIAILNPSIAGKKGRNERSVFQSAIEGKSLKRKQNPVPEEFAPYARTRSQKLVDVSRPKNS